MAISRELETISGELFDHSNVWGREPAGNRTPSARLPDEFGLSHERVDGEAEFTCKGDFEDWILTACALDM